MEVIKASNINLAKLVLYFSKHNYVLSDGKIVKSNDNTVYMVNASNIENNIIRISISESLENENEINEVKENIEKLRKRYKIENVDFLDIHISNKFTNHNEIFKTVYLEDNHYDGTDIRKHFPEINENYLNKSVFKDVKKIEYLKAHTRNMLQIPVTLGFIILCTAIYFASLIIGKNYSQSTALIVTGADYKMFTLGLNQFYRLITMAFNHGSIFHLLFNMYSLYALGGFCEIRYGKIKYVLILLFCILISSLTNGILTDNALSIGISGGLYGLLFIYIKTALDAKVIDIFRLLPLIIVNGIINFMSNIAWQAHIGGLIAGIIVYYALEPQDKKRRYISYGFIFLMILVLFVKYVSVKEISPIYAGTDFEVIEFLNNIGFKSYASKLSTKLFNAYIKYGG